MKSDPIKAKIIHFPALALELTSIFMLRVVLKITNERRKAIIPEKIIIVWSGKIIRVRDLIFSLLLFDRMRITRKSITARKINPTNPAWTLKAEKVLASVSVGIVIHGKKRAIKRRIFPSSAILYEVVRLRKLKLKRSARRWSLYFSFLLCEFAV